MRYCIIICSAEAPEDQVLAEGFSSSVFWGPVFLVFLLTTAQVL